jgi:oligopeptide transport system substrate-binding protein
MKFSKVLVLLLVVALVAGMFVGCGPKEEAVETKEDTAAATEEKKEESKEEAKEEAKPAVPQVLRLTTGSDIPGLDCNIATDAASFEVLGNTVEGLFRLGKNDVAENALVESYEMSDDGLHWTFHLRQDSVWNNGTPVTAHDFVYSWKRLADPNTGSQYAFMIETAGLANATKVTKGEATVEELGVKAIDDYTLELTLDIPVPFLKGLLTFPSFDPINEEFQKKHGDAYGTSIETMLFNGPFVLSTWETEYEFVLTRNPNYYDADKVKLEEVSFRIVKDANTTLNLYEAGDVDMAGLVGEQIEQYEDHPHLKKVPKTAVFYLQLNQGNKVLANLNARKAFSLAVDKTFIADEILANGSIAADYLVPHTLAAGPDGKDFRDGTPTYNNYDGDKAAEYWAKAKEELGIDTFEIEFLTYDGETSRRISEYIQGQLQSNLEGLTVTIAQQPFKNKLALEDEGDYDFSFAGWGPDYGDPMTFLDMWITESGHNVIGFSNEDYDTIIKRTKMGDLTTDLATRWTELKRAEKILLEDNAAIIPLYQKGAMVLQQPKIKGLERHAFAPDFSYKDVTIEE